MKKFKIEFKWAVVIMIIFLAWMTLEKQLGFHDEKLKWQVFFGMLIIIPNFVLYFLAIRNKKKNYYNGEMTWKQGFISGIVISFIVVIFSPFTQFITYEFIVPDFFDKMVALSVESKRLSEEEAKSYFNLSASTWQSISSGLSYGIVLGAIVAYILKTKTPLLNPKTK